MKTIKRLLESAQNPLNQRQRNFSKAVIATLAISILTSPFIGVYALVGPAFLLAALAIPLADVVKSQRLHGQVN